MALCSCGLSYSLGQDTRAPFGSRGLCYYLGGTRFSGHNSDYYFGTNNQRLGSVCRCSFADNLRGFVYQVISRVGYLEVDMWRFERGNFFLMGILFPVLASARQGQDIGGA